MADAEHETTGVEAEEEDKKDQNNVVVKIGLVGDAQVHRSDWSRLV